MAIASETGEMGPPSRQMHRSFLPSSAKHFSATGFLFRFLILPTSTVILCLWRTSSLNKEESPRARSTLRTEGGLARGHNLRQKHSRPARRDSQYLLSSKKEEV